jgi:hypothetical protein
MSALFSFEFVLLFYPKRKGKKERKKERKKKFL